MKAIELKVGKVTIVTFPAEWSKLSFSAHQDAVLADDDARISVSMRLALRVRYIHDTFFVGPDRKRPPRYRETGHESFKEWCESIDRTDQWGKYLVAAADHANRVENPAQARVLSGLSDDDADEVSERAQESGEPVTAAGLQQARDDIEQERSAVVSGNRQAAQRIEEAVELRKMMSCLDKAKMAGQRHGGMPEAFFKDVERWIRYCREQVGLEVA